MSGVLDWNREVRTPAGKKPLGAQRNDRTLHSGGQITEVFGFQWNPLESRLGFHWLLRRWLWLRLWLCHRWSWFPRRSKTEGCEGKTSMKDKGSNTLCKRYEAIVGVRPSKKAENKTACADFAFRLEEYDMKSWPVRPALSPFVS